MKSSNSTIGRLQDNSGTQSNGNSFVISEPKQVKLLASSFDNIGCNVLQPEEGKAIISSAENVDIESLVNMYKNSKPLELKVSQSSSVYADFKKWILPINNKEINQYMMLTGDPSSTVANVVQYRAKMFYVDIAGAVLSDQTITYEEDNSPVIPNMFEIKPVSIGPSPLNIKLAIPNIPMLAQLSTVPMLSISTGADEDHATNVGVMASHPFHCLKIPILLLSDTDIATDIITVDVKNVASGVTDRLLMTPYTGAYQTDQAWDQEKEYVNIPTTGSAAENQNALFVYGDHADLVDSCTNENIALTHNTNSLSFFSDKDIFSDITINSIYNNQSCNDAALAYYDTEFKECVMNDGFVFDTIARENVEINYIDLEDDTTSSPTISVTLTPISEYARSVQPPAENKSNINASKTTRLFGSGLYVSTVSGISHPTIESHKDEIPLIQNSANRCSLASGGYGLKNVVIASIYSLSEATIFMLKYTTEVDGVEDVHLGFAISQNGKMYFEKNLDKTVKVTSSNVEILTIRANVNKKEEKTVTIKYKIGNLTYITVLDAIQYKYTNNIYTYLENLDDFIVSTSHFYYNEGETTYIRKTFINDHTTQISAYTPFINVFGRKKEYMVGSEVRSKWTKYTPCRRPICIYNSSNMSSIVANTSTRVIRKTYETYWKDDAYIDFTAKAYMGTNTVVKDSISNISQKQSYGGCLGFTSQDTILRGHLETANTLPYYAEAHVFNPIFNIDVMVRNNPVFCCISLAYKKRLEAVRSYYTNFYTSWEENCGRYGTQWQRLLKDETPTATQMADSLFFFDTTSAKRYLLMTSNVHGYSSYVPSTGKQWCSIVSYPTNVVDQYGVIQNQQLASVVLNGGSFNEFGLHYAADIVSLHPKRIMDNRYIYIPSNLYEYNGIAYDNTLVSTGADTVIREVYNVMNYWFLNISVGGVNYFEIYMKSEDMDKILIYGGSGSIINKPVLVGKRVWFATSNDNKLAIDVNYIEQGEVFRSRKEILTEAFKSCFITTDKGLDKPLLIYYVGTTVTGYILGSTGIVKMLTKTGVTGLTIITNFESDGTIRTMYSINTALGSNICYIEESSDYSDSVISSSNLFIPETNSNSYRNDSKHVFNSVEIIGVINTGYTCSLELVSDNNVINVGAGELSGSTIKFNLDNAICPDIIRYKVTFKNMDVFAVKLVGQTVETIF